MSNKKDDVERMLEDFEASEEMEEIELDLNLIDKLSESIISAVENTLEQEEADISLELLTVLSSVGSQLAVDLGLERDSYLNMLAALYEESEEEYVCDGCQEDGKFNWN